MIERQAREEETRGSSQAFMLWLLSWISSNEPQHEIAYARLEPHDSHGLELHRIEDTLVAITPNFVDQEKTQLEDSTEL